MTPAPERRSPEPLRDQIFVAFGCARGAALLAYALAPVTDDLGPAQTLVLAVLLAALCLAAIRRRAYRPDQAPGAARGGRRLAGRLRKNRGHRPRCACRA